MTAKLIAAAPTIARDYIATLDALDAAHARIRELESDSRKHSVAAEAAECRLADMREALEPFPDIDGEGDEDFPDDTKAVLKFGRTTSYTLTLGDLRRARAALNSTKEAAGDEWYSGRYAEFLAAYSPGAKVKALYYNTPFTRHFYSADQIAAMKAAWPQR